MDFDDSTADARFDALTETLTDALIIIDSQSRIQFSNPALEDILGYSPEEVRGERLTRLMPGNLKTRHLEAVDRYLTTGEQTLDWEHIELPGQHKDGHEVPLSISFSEFELGGEQYFTGVLRDISDRRTLEAERDLLHATKDEIAKAEDLSEGLTATLRLIGESMNWVHGEAWIPAADGESIEWDSWWEAADVDCSAYREASADLRFESGNGLVGRVWQTGESEWIPNVASADGSVFERAPAATNAGFKATLGVPIRTNGTVVAVLVFYMQEEQNVDERMVEVTQAVAADLGLLMARKRAEETLREERDLVSNILQTTPAGIVVLNVRGEFDYVNERAEELLRIEPDENGQYPSAGDISFTVLNADGEPVTDAEHPYRTVLRNGEEVKSDVGVEYPDGDQRWLAVHGTPLRGPDGDVTRAVFAFEDVTERKRRADRLERLNELGQELTDVESFESACEHAVTGAQEILDLPVTTVERYDPETGRLDPCARTPQVEDLVGDNPLFASERDLPWQAFVQNQPQIYNDIHAETDLDADETALSSAIILPLDQHGVFISGATEINAFSETDVRLAENLAGNIEAVFDRLDREEELRTQKSELETKNNQLQRVQRVNEEIRDITQALMDATSKAEIQRLVVDRLANSDPYRFVWFGERDLATDDIVPTASAGVEEGYLDTVEVTADTSETGQGPAGRAIRSHEPQIQNNLQSDPPFEPWRQEAMQRGYRASIAVPVVYNGTCYGLLNLYANEPEVFTEMEEAVLTELGEMIGYALNAMERYNALVSEDSVELEFVIRDFSNPLMNLLRERGGSVRLENIGNRVEGSLRVFVAFTGLDFETIESFFEQHVGGDDLTLIRNRNGEIIVELLLPDDSFLVSLVERGAIPADIRATPEEGRITVRIPQSASVREYVELFRDRYGDDVDLVARRESPEPVQSRAEFERAYVDRLTERQQEVLQTAYFAGFFEQPREHSAEDIAEMLGVSQPTVSRHVRNSEQTLFSMLFGDG
ncbi:GAF domain-containing protein [Halosimplex halophilum]|uniref:GAF domain-containing protein n=1 Tax=Halosimplex halophilum TaxID=2559572 RepID=UPI00107F4CC3|nr:GAF domain-containing protein [Halosimplex halophilum]